MGDYVDAHGIGRSMTAGELMREGERRAQESDEQAVAQALGKALPDWPEAVSECADVVIGMLRGLQRRDGLEVAEAVSTLLKHNGVTSPSSVTVFGTVQHALRAVPLVVSEPQVGEPFVYQGVEGWVSDLKSTVRECIDCGCLTPGGPTRCKRCVRDLKAAPVSEPQGEVGGDAKTLRQAAIDVVVNWGAPDSIMRPKVTTLNAALAPGTAEYVTNQLVHAERKTLQERLAATQADLARVTAELQTLQHTAATSLLAAIAERDEARRERDVHREGRAIADTLRTAAEAEVVRLREALEYYRDGSTDTGRRARAALTPPTPVEVTEADRVAARAFFNARRMLHGAGEDALARRFATHRQRATGERTHDGQ